MRRSFLLLFITTLSLFARYGATPAKNCPAYNNMKHTQNSHAVHLDTHRQYTVLQHHKGQILLLINGEHPAQRWVDEKCFSSGKEPEITEHTKKYEKVSGPHNLLLALSWQNAFCETHRKRKECHRNVFSFGTQGARKHDFVLHGLWPQPADNTYCHVPQTLISLDKHRQWNRLPEPTMDAALKKALQKVMPGVSSKLHRHEWIKHGSCYGSDAAHYFSDAVVLTEQFNRSRAARFFADNAGSQVTLAQVRFAVNRSFGTGAGKRVELRCRNGLITELWLHLGKANEADLSAMLRKGKEVHSKCRYGIIDRAGYGK